ncbi:MAG: hypothetical protein SFY56_14195 [Bacteroidota bacterium]|nr:hypothetical protein [Bacteroidota bacterium]
MIGKICYCQNSIIDLSSLKNSKNYYSTSTVISKKKCANYPKNSSKNSFFGRYFFLDKEKPDIHSGYTLTVEDSVKPWKFGNKTERFIELTCLKNNTNISVINNINLSNGSKELISKLGKPIMVNNKYYVFKKDDYLLSFYIENEKITKYRIGKYNSTTQISEILKKHLTSF